ncbi:hypothetical protein [Phytohabitans rumicis]|uniref:Uncharacterized protein n=1 Tax=Phytohabitans rumicis TaxID=1076125 RepID=A0A6V8KS86_9ACTN|nr:hypothetical protein [Phytohabitans rumicis]GFJ86714.1 hypothetical protein Prum_003560 [Phytohabitans rumicis]
MPDKTSRRPGSVRVTVADAERRRGVSRRLIVHIGVYVLASILAAAAVVVGVRLIGATAADQADAAESALDPRTLALPAGTTGAVPGSTRLELLGPVTLLDSRRAGGRPLAPGASAPLKLPALPAGASALLLEVSLTAATGPGAVTIDTQAGQVTALRVPAARAQRSATIVVGVGSDGEALARTGGGGHLLVNLVGAFQPVEEATSGRIVVVPPTQVLRLVPDTDGKDATIDLSRVPAVRKAGTIGAALLHISADVGRRGGFVALGDSAKKLDQRVFWMATSGADRTREGFLVVPVTDGKVSLHYQAGELLTANLVGYVTGEGAASQVAGLVVPVKPGAGEPVPVVAGKQTDVTVIPPAGIDGVPADRVTAVLLAVSASSDGPARLAVFPPDSKPPADPVLNTAAGPERQTLTPVRTVAGAVRVTSATGASVSLVPQAVILTG